MAACKASPGSTRHKPSSSSHDFAPQRSLDSSDAHPTLPEKKNSFISSLPDDILLDVLEYFPVNHPFWHQSEYGKQFPLMLVCKRWTKLYELIFYRKIDLGCRGFDNRTRVTRLEQTLEARPELRYYVREMAILMSDEDDDSCRITTRIVTHCSKIRRISLHVTWARSLPILGAISKLTALECLSLSGHYGGPSFVTVIQTLNLTPALKYLKLRRCGNPEHNAYIQAQRQYSSMTSYSTLQKRLSLHDILPSPSRSHHQTLTRLELSSPDLLPCFTRLLLKWPRRLTSLTLTGLGEVPQHLSEIYEPKIIQALISIHSRTLQSLQLGTLPFSLHLERPLANLVVIRPELNVLDFSGFPQLERLYLSAYSVFGQTLDHKQATYRALGARLAAPRLRLLELTFAMGTQYEIATWGMGPRQCQWLKWLVEGCLDYQYQQHNQPHRYPRWQRGDGNARAQEKDEDDYEEGEDDEEEELAPSVLPKELHVHIEFSPDVETDDLEASHEFCVKWPWVHLEELRDAFKPTVTLTWNRPQLSRAEWEGRVHQGREDRIERAEVQGKDGFGGLFS